MYEIDQRYKYITDTMVWSLFLSFNAYSLKPSFPPKMRIFKSPVIEIHSKYKHLKTC